MKYVYNNARLCSSHFDDSAFTSTIKNKLSVAAMPKPDGVHSSITNDTASVSADCGPSESVETRDSFLVIHDTTPKSTSKYKPRVVRTPKTKKILQLKAKYRILEKKLNACQKKKSNMPHLKDLLNATQYEFVLSQLKAAKVKDKRGRRWSPKDKSMALNIYLHSPSAYSILRKFFAFPCKNTLQRSTGRIGKKEGLCPKVLDILTAKSKKMDPKDKLCTLVFDEMAIKSYLSYNADLDSVDGFESAKRQDGTAPQLATQALVFMIRGICKNWKQVYIICLLSLYVYVFIYLCACVL